MHRNLALPIIISCTLVAGASGIARAQRSGAQAEDSTFSPRQTASVAQNEDGKGSISGRVVNENGTPAVGRVISLYYGRRGAHPHLSVQTGLIQTDKRGRFYVADLLAGEYILSVAQPCCQGSNEDSKPPNDANEAPYYKTEFTYYKDTPDRKDAAPVWVNANVNTVGIDIILRTRTLHKVSGTVFNRDGHPLSRALVEMTRKQSPDTGPHSRGVSTQADEKGNWSLTVPDGVYIIQAFNVIVTNEGSQNRPNVLPVMPSFYKEPAQPRQVSVSGSDVGDVKIDMNRRAQILSGRFVLENGLPIPPEATIDVGITSDYNYKTIAADGSFQLKGGPSLGERFLRVIIQGVDTYYVKSINWEDTDYMLKPFEFGNGTDYKGVQVVLSPSGSLLEGNVRFNGTSQPVTKGHVWLIPEDETKWRAPLTWSSSRIDENGAFTFYGAPGSYLIILDEGVDAAQFDPFAYLDSTEDYVRERAPGARHILLRAGERASVELSKQL